MSQRYDTVFTGGEFLTMDESCPRASVVGVKDGLIAYLGDDLPKGEWDEEVTLGGRRVIPGLIDNHIHPIYLADTLEQIPCLPPHICSVSGILKAVEDRAEKTPKGEWICGWGFYEKDMAEGRFPTRWELDEVAPDHPVMIYRICMHIVVVNSKALEIAGINRNTPQPDDGVIEKDEDGEPNGILKESIRFKMEEYAPTSHDVTIRRLLKLSRHLLSQGITGVADSSGNLLPENSLDLYREAQKLGFRQRVGVYYLWEQMDEDRRPLSEADKDTSKDAYVAGVKLIGDGSLSGMTAWCSEPYTGHEGEHGMPTAAEEDYLAAAEYAKAQGIQVKAHGMGDLTIKRIAGLFSENADWLKDGRPSVRIEHTTMPDDKSLDIIAKSGIALTIQPIFLFAEIASYLEHIGIDRTRNTYPVNRILDKGILLGFSSDAPATSWPDPSDPFLAMENAVRRISVDGTDTGREHRLPIEEVLKCYTVRSQKIMGMQKVGSLQVGNHADMVVLSQDLLSTEPEKIHETEVDMVYMDGKEVYTKRGEEEK